MGCDVYLFRLNGSQFVNKAADKNFHASFKDYLNMTTGTS